VPSGSRKLLKIVSSRASWKLFSFAVAVGCKAEEGRRKELNMALQYPPYEEYLEARLAAGRRLNTTEQDYKRWKKYHDSLVAILESCGTVSSSPNPSPDFYHTGDWFSTYEDGFDLRNTKIFTGQVLAKLQDCVASTDPGAIVEFCGIEGEALGLDIFVTPDAAYIHWTGVSAAEFQELSSQLKRGQ
jgi:hypothetical protein